MTFSQSTGALRYDDGSLVGASYYQKLGQAYPYGHAGNGAGRNNRSMQYVHNVGPLPGADEEGVGGQYSIGTWGTHPTLGPISAPLTPIAYPALPTDPKGFAWLEGRGGFWIHGPEFSEGCVVQEEPIRLEASTSTEKVLTVIP